MGKQNGIIESWLLFFFTTVGWGGCIPQFLEFCLEWEVVSTCLYGLSYLLNPSLTEWVWIFVFLFFSGFESYHIVSLWALMHLQWRPCQRSFFWCFVGATVVPWRHVWIQLQGRSTMLLAKPCRNEGGTTIYKPPPPPHGMILPARQFHRSSW